MDNYISRVEHNEFARRMEDEHERQNHRISSLEKTVQQLHDITISVQQLADNMKSMLDEQQKQGARLSKLEEKPGENWNAVVKTIITTLTGGLVGALVTLLIK